MMLAPFTSDNTIFVGNRDSRYDSIPKLYVVFTTMQVCCGVTTESIIAATS